MEDAKVQIIPDLGADRYLIEIVAVVDGAELHAAKDKYKFIETIVAKVMFPGLVTEIIGKMALARLIPKDQRKVLIRRYLDECQKDFIVPTSDGIRNYLRAHGIEK